MVRKFFMLKLLLLVSILSGCSYFKKEPVIEGPKQEVAADTHVEGGVTNDSQSSEIKEEVVSEGAVAAGAGPVRGLSADFRKKYDEQIRRKEPAVIKPLEEEVKEESEKLADKNPDEVAPEKEPIVKVASEEIKAGTSSEADKKTSDSDIDSMQPSSDAPFAFRKSAKSNSEVAKSENTEKTETTKETENVENSSAENASSEAKSAQADEFDTFSQNIKKMDNEETSEFTESESRHVEADEQIIVPSADEPRDLSEFDGTESAVSYLAGVVYFDNGSERLSSDGISLVKYIATIVQETGGTIRIVGHASSRTTNLEPLDHMLANFSISLERARTVARALVASGIPANKIFMGAVSDTDPVYLENMPVGEEMNRRTEIYIDN